MLLQYLPLAQSVFGNRESAAYAKVGLNAYALSGCLEHPSTAFSSFSVLMRPTRRCDFFFYVELTMQEKSGTAGANSWN